MKTKILKEPAEAALILKEGDPVAIPTETVYGLAASIYSNEAIEKIYKIKGRPVDNPLIVHVSSLEQVEEIAERIPDNFYLLAKAFFPGPLTVILPKRKGISDKISAGLATIGIRMPNHPLALKVIDHLGSPIAAPSANLSGKPSSTCVQHVLNDFEGKLRAILEGGPCIYGLESTVISLEPNVTILRPGSIRKELIEEVLKTRVSLSNGMCKTPPSPGMKYRHYSPNGNVYLFKSEASLEEWLANGCRKKRLVLKNLSSDCLYDTLRQADIEGIEEILVLISPTMDADLALMNRLERASEG